jgi:two-component system chemotaxis sensor kinase CheA
MMFDDDTVRLYVDEAQEHLSGIEDLLLQIESDGAAADLDLVNQVFRAIHSIKGGAGFFGLTKIKDLGHDMENVLNMIRNQELVASSDVANILLKSADLLRQMVDDIENSNDIDISGLLTQLQAIQPGGASDTGTTQQQAASPARESAGDSSAPSETTAEKRTRSRREELLTASDLDAALALHDAVYRVDIDARQDLKSADRTFKDFVGTLEQLGNIMACSTDLQRKSEPRRGMISFAIGTSKTAAGIADATALKIEQVVSLAGSADDASDHASDDPSKAAMNRDDSSDTSAAVDEPAPMPAPVARSQATAAEQAPAMNRPSRPPVAESKLRVSVKLLDQLMTLAGELVLTRNQMSLAIASSDTAQTHQASQRLDQITSELQEVIVSTRMQPVGVVFTKFRRIVRDMAQQLGKDIALVIEGEEVELDKTIIEGLSDPLTHLVRNGIDHGIELPSDRTASGKPEQATLSLKAFHEAGQVIIEVADDGAGIDPEKVKNKALEKGLKERSVLDAMSDAELVKLIFLPGFSTAGEITDISGRGVGMDVVNTNLTEMGGVVDVKSAVGKGTTIRIKLPLTLAIIPSLIIGLGEKRYAIPQVNVQELVRIPAVEIPERIQSIGNSEIMRLRGELLPIVRLSDILRLEPVYRDKETGELKRDRRRILADRRGSSPDDAGDGERRENGTRRSSFESAVNIVVVLAGSLRYGLVVDQLMDSEEIVVKPLDKHFKAQQIYAGATIQGDGGVAMILDVVELSRFVELDPSRVESLELARRQQMQRDEQTGDKMSLLLVKTGGEDTFAIPLPLIARIEKIESRQIEVSGRRRSMIYRNGTLVLFTLNDVADVSPLEHGEELYAVVFAVSRREVGLLVSSIEDTVNVAVEFDRETFRQPGIFGSAIIHDRTTLLVDLHGVVEAVEPEWTRRGNNALEKTKGHTVLVVEDSKFFLGHLKSFLEEHGFTVITAEDGQEGLEQLQKHSAEIDLVMTDIEMPVMDGFEFTKHIRESETHRHLPVIAVTSLAGDMDKARGFDAGVNEYLIKLDKEEILNSLDRHLDGADGARGANR